MKQFNLWFILALIAVLAMTCASQLKTDNTYAVLTDTIPEQDTIKLDDIIQQVDRDGIIHFDTNKTKHLHGFTGDSIVHYYGYLFDIGEHNELQLAKVSYKKRKAFGNYHRYLYTLKHKGYPLNGFFARFDVKNNKVFRGGFQKLSIDIDTSQIKSKETVLESIKYITKKYKTSPSMPTTIGLGIEKINKTYKLVYSVSITSFIPLDKRLVIVDAITGKVLVNTSTKNNCDDGHIIPALCINRNRYNVNKGILYYQNNSNLPTIDPIPNSSYSWQNPVLAGTKSFFMDTCLTGEYVYYDSLNNTKRQLFDFSGPPTSYWGLDDSGKNDCVANTGHWGSQVITDYFKNTHSFNSIKYLTVALPSGNIKSSWVGDTTQSQWSIFLGRGSGGGKPLVTLDIMGHEFAHGVDYYSGNFSNSYTYKENVIIEESFCDIMGITIESKFTPNDWIIGNDNMSEIRSLKAPENSNSHCVIGGIEKYAAQPKFYKGHNWTYPDSIDMVISDTITARGIYAHHNTGVLNYWFYLISEGTNGNYTNEVGNTYNFDGINIDSAANIVYLSLIEILEDMDTLLYPHRDFKDLRKATLTVAREQYGDCSQAAQTIRKAWDAVGITGTCELFVDVTTRCVGKKCIASLDICGRMASLPLPTIKWYKKKSNGTYVYLSQWDQRRSAKLRCGKDYKVEVIDNSSPSSCFVVEYFTCKDNADESISVIVIPSPVPCPPYVEFGATLTVVNNCGDNNNINLNLSGGVPPYSYNWSNGDNSQNLTNVTSGTYSVTVTDACYNTLTRTVTVNGYPALNAFGNIVYPNCISLPPHEDPGGGSNSTISINLTTNGGQAPYTYNWSNGTVSQNLTNVVMGNYSVTITDVNSCSEILSFTATMPTPQIYAVGTTATCPLTNDGTITTNVIGGTPPYNFIWSGLNNSQTVQNPTNVGNGTHYVTVRDAKNCTDNITVVVPTASYTYIDDLNNCERIYTCNGNQISEDKIDYSNISNDFKECEGTAPCLLTGGQNQTVPGSIQSYYIGGFFQNVPKCKHYCEINGAVNTATTPNNPITFGPALPGYSSTCDSGDGTLYAVYCDGGFAGHWCDDQDIYISIIMGICPTCSPPPPRALTTNPPPLNSPNYNGDDVEVVPNPFTNYFTIIFESEFDNNVNMKLTNILGQEVENDVLSIGKGLNMLRIDTKENLTKGIYILSLEFPDGSVYTQKLLKQ
ncbi:MAG: M4 family metallopeptidase [Saprospiraceae bacterium]